MHSTRADLLAGSAATEKPRRHTAAPSCWRRTRSSAPSSPAGSASWPMEEPARRNVADPELGDELEPERFVERQRAGIGRVDDRPRAFAVAAREARAEQGGGVAAPAVLGAGAEDLQVPGAALGDVRGEGAVVLGASSRLSGSVSASSSSPFGDDLRDPLARGRAAATRSRSPRGSPVDHSSSLRGRRRRPRRSAPAAARHGPRRSCPSSAAGRRGARARARSIAASRWAAAQRRIRIGGWPTT